MTAIHRFEILHKIATGGMADIYVALQYGDGGFEREVIIKRLHPHLAEQQEALQMFIGEATLLARLGHPGFPVIYDYRLHPTGWYMALEWIRGPSLQHLMQQIRETDQKIPLEMSLATISQAAAAIHHAHEMRNANGELLQVIHGDLAPANILLHRNGVVKIIDFGVARTRENTKLSNRLQGTLRYMSPEQVRGIGAIDHRADIFALGVVLYEMTTGQRPFDGADIQVMTAIAEGDFQRPSELVPDYPAALEELILACLETEATNRPHDAAELTWALHDLGQAMELPLDPNTLADRLDVVFPVEAEIRPSQLPEARVSLSGEAEPEPDEAIQLHSWEELEPDA